MDSPNADAWTREMRDGFEHLIQGATSGGRLYMWFLSNAMSDLSRMMREMILADQEARAQGKALADEVFTKMEKEASCSGESS